MADKILLFLYMIGVLLLTLPSILWEFLVETTQFLAGVIDDIRR